MAVDAFLKIEDPEVKGESPVKGFEKQIQILDINWGIHNAAGGHFGHGSGVGKADFHDISVVKRFDSASPTLMGFCANGKHFGKGTITLRKVGGDEKPMDWLVIKIDHVFISSIAPSGLTTGEGMEQLTLNFDKINLQYVTQTEKGAKDAPIDFTYDVRQVSGGPK